MARRSGRAGRALAGLTTADYVDIEGFDISDDASVGIANQGSYVRILGNHVHNIPALGTGTNGGADIVNGNYKAHDSDIIGNVVHDIGDACGRQIAMGVPPKNAIRAL
ncbi:MAG: hypothetical protein ABSD48_19935 [Armatimonadota bacterium]